MPVKRAARSGAQSKAGAQPKDEVKRPLVRIFVSYSHQDEDARKRLEVHLSQLTREDVEIWYDGRMIAGTELDPAIKKAMRQANIFVALASPHYLHSEYCFDKEYTPALKRAGRKTLHVVVALIHECQWRHTRMRNYKLLPRDGKPVDQWARRGDAYENVVNGIRDVVKVVRAEKSAGPTATKPVAVTKPLAKKAKAVTTVRPGPAPKPKPPYAAVPKRVAAKKPARKAAAKSKKM